MFKVSPREKKLDFWIMCLSGFAGIINSKERERCGRRWKPMRTSSPNTESQTGSSRVWPPFVSVWAPWLMILLDISGEEWLNSIFHKVCFILPWPQKRHIACLGEKVMSCQEGQIRSNLRTSQDPRLCSCRVGELLCLSVPLRNCVSPSGSCIQSSCSRHLIRSHWLWVTRHVRTADIVDVCTCFPLLSHLSCLNSSANSDISRAQGLTKHMIPSYVRWGVNSTQDCIWWYSVKF